MSFCAMPDCSSAAVIADIVFEVVSAASLTVFALAVTPPPSRAVSGATSTLPSPPTTIRASMLSCGCAGCAEALGAKQAAAPTIAIVAANDMRLARAVRIGMRAPCTALRRLLAGRRIPILLRGVVDGLRPGAFGLLGDDGRRFRRQEH